jgi:N-acetyl-gamma-glutamyl-phosphate reductase
VYGLPERNAERIAATDRVAAPGCYPTSAILALAPLLEAAMIEPPLIVDSLSGVSGAGRTLSDSLQFGAVDESVKAYSVAEHRHRPEIERGLGGSVAVTFTPHLVPMQRGILTTSYARSAASRDELHDVLAKAYDDAFFVDVSDVAPETRWVVGSNRCVISVFKDEHTGTAIVVSALDNLVKGASGQAVQCANLMLGLDETAGLPVDGWMP